MDDLRAEIRAAFEKEQAAHPPFAGLRRNVVDKVTAHPRREHDLHWLAVAAAAVLTIAVVVGLMSIRPHRANVPAQTPTADYGTPPAGVPLIYVQDPNHQAWLIGFDWAGRPRGTVKLAQPLSNFSGLAQSPDGSAFGYSPGGNGAYTQYFDRLGHLISDQGSSVSPESEMWADDAWHLCSLSYSSQGQWTLGTKLPGGGQESVFPVAIDPRIARSGNFGIALATCSVSNDRAVLVRDVGSGPTDLWVVRLSNGRILAHRAYSIAGLVNLVASPDGALVGENSVYSGPRTIIRRASDGSVVAELDPSSWVFAFNADDSLALIATNPTGFKAVEAVMDLRTGTVLWSYEGAEFLDGSLSQPGGRDFAVMLQEPNTLGMEHRAVTVVIVHGDGTSIQLPRRYVPLVS